MQILVVSVILVHVSHHVSAVDMYEGGWFLLPCEFHTFEMDNPTVVWSRYGLSPSIVHQHQLDGDELKDQNQLYRGRTSMSTDSLKTGDLSLNLTGLIVSDSGNYTCYVRSAGGERKVTDVHLQVKEQFPSWAKALLILLPILFIIAVALLAHFRHFFMPVYQVKVESGEESVLLPCKTLVCLPADIRVEWKDNLNRMAHVYRNGSEQPTEEHRHYKGRSEMKRNLGTGDFSLSLKYPTDEDTGPFTCIVCNKEGKRLIEKQVTLKVKVQPVEVDSGEKSVLLPCKTTVDLTEGVKVEWKDNKNRKVHVYHPGSDQLEEQYSIYRGRTEMNLLGPGDTSLSLKDPTDEDTGTFICTVYNREREIMMKKQVQLKVKEDLTESFESLIVLNPEKAYKMNRRRRGLALIFNQQSFHWQLGLNDRRGSEVDAPILKKSLKHLGFEVKVFTDLNKHDINAALDEAANADHSDADCFLLVFMSHGEDGYVYAYDDKLAMNDITDKFKGTNCSSLVGKPKIFIWQGDSGKERDQACVDMDPEDDDVEVGSVNTVPAAADFIMCHAAAKGCCSYRHRANGSWYIQDLCEVLQKYGTSLEFTQLLTLVNANVSKRDGGGNYRAVAFKQVPRFTSVLTKKLYFHPK